MKKIIILVIFALFLSGNTVSAISNEVIVDGSSVEGSSSVAELPTPDGSSVLGSTLSTEVPPTDGSEVGGSTVVPTDVPVIRSSRSGGSRRVTTPVGQVLGAQTEATSTATSTCEIFMTFMKRGANNDVNEVKKLQKFLNANASSTLPITGFFGPLTEQAVKNFQTKNSELILAPWVKAGIMKEAVATGYFYKTTQYAANKILCPNSTIEMPILK